ncbi:MAG: DHH family phosphoesterase [Elusimicrobia bacterium]|nr:DHH family phosphoesterase [Elusimicrobiota bacterium]
MKRSKSSIARRVSAEDRRLLRFLRTRREALSPLLILTHDYPDPDSLASAFALKAIAEDVGITCRIGYGGVIGRTENRAMVKLLKIPVRPVRDKDFARWDHVALVDTQPAFSNNRFPHGRRATIVVDQHRSVTPPDAELPIVNTRCGATSVIVANALLARRVAPPEPVATALAYGILTDTLDFFRASHPVVVRTYLRLLPHCDLSKLARIQNPRRSRRFFQTIARGIRQASVCGPLIVSHVGTVENPDLVSQTADFLLSYENIAWSFATGRYNGRLYMSLRASSEAAEAGEVLRDICGDRANAGGHGSIAGGSFSVGRNTAESGWRAEENALLVRLLDRLRVGRRPIVFPFRGAEAGD